MSEKFVHNSERDAQIPPDVLAIIDNAYEAPDLAVMIRANEAIVAFNGELEKDFSRPSLKHSVLWHKLAGSGIEGKIYPLTDTVLIKINTRIIDFVRTVLKEIVS